MKHPTLEEQVNIIRRVMRNTGAFYIYTHGPYHGKSIYYILHEDETYLYERYINAKMNDVELAAYKTYM